jgi:SOS response regulatory protein OraA/RecX
VTSEVHEAALRMLARRSLSVGELEERLGRKGFDRDVIAREIRALTRVGLVNDEALATALCEGVLRRGYGRRAAYATLRRRKLPRAMVEEATAAVDEDALHGALQVSLRRALERYPQWRALPGQRRKVIRYLLTRGFTASAVRDALAAHDGDAQNAEDPFQSGDPPDLP